MAPKSTQLLSKLKNAMGPVDLAAAPVPASTPIRPVVQFSGAEKRSISLYQPDLDRLDDIKEYMKGQGVRNLSDSEAVRLACRVVPIGDALVSAYRDMQQEDGRRKVE